jgi:hypothetical protein
MYPETAVSEAGIEDDTNKEWCRTICLPEQHAKTDVAKLKKIWLRTGIDCLKVHHLVLV